MKRKDGAKDGRGKQDNLVYDARREVAGVADEVDTLNRITAIFLETAELRVKRKMDLTLPYYRTRVTVKVVPLFGSDWTAMVPW